jgi:hypothetical protein
MTVLCSVLPVFGYLWKPRLEPAPKMVALNAWIRGYAVSRRRVRGLSHGDEG